MIKNIWHETLWSIRSIVKTVCIKRMVTVCRFKRASFSPRLLLLLLLSSLLLLLLLTTTPLFCLLLRPFVLPPVLPSVRRRPACELAAARVGVVVVQGHVERLRVFHFRGPPVCDGVPDPRESSGDAVVLELVFQVATNVTSECWNVGEKNYNLLDTQLGLSLWHRDLREIDCSLVIVDRPATWCWIWGQIKTLALHAAQKCASLWLWRLVT